MLWQTGEACTRVGDQPADTEGYEKAEVTAGGVDTDELSSKTMECLNVKGLFSSAKSWTSPVILVDSIFSGVASGAAAGRAL